MSDELDYVRSQLAEQRNEIKEFMGYGNLKEFSEYMKLVGIILGLDRAEQVIVDLQTRMEKDTDE